MLRLFTLLLPLMLATGHAHGAMRSVRQVTVSAPAACPYATDNGCAAANVNGEFKDATLLTAAQQSGQNSLLPSHPMAFNIPAVDYPIGPDKTLTPQDPRNINDSVCHYVNVGGSPTVEVILCNAAGLINYTLNNYDFGGHKIGKGPVVLYLDKTPSVVSLGSTFTITNCYFDVPSGTGSWAGFGVGIGFTGNWSVISQNNHFDGANADLGSDAPFRDDDLALGTTFSSTYDVFTHVNTVRVYGGGANSGVAQSFQYDYIRGMNDLNTTSHGEVSLISCGSGTNPNCANQTIDHFIAKGLFIINNSLTDAYCSGGGGMGGCINSAQLFLSAGDKHGIKYTTVNVINNVTVTNTVGAPGGGPATPATSRIWGEALFAVGWSNSGNLTATGNWVDATGSALCSVNGPGDPSITASQSGHTVTITAVSGSFANFPIEPNWQFWRSGVLAGTITAMGTSFGGTGTVTVDTSATIASDSNWIVLPGNVSATFSGNYNLADPSHVGTPTAMNIGGPDMSAANCLGAH